mmetsp:Transcript_7077/g.43609  ORF Transcript_7077/g.43609 Transcript_7077/m.43609 type:complete len:263 (+) Transcript_7077:2098-2886(+)
MLSYLCMFGLVVPPPRACRRYSRLVCFPSTCATSGHVAPSVGSHTRAFVARHVHRLSLSCEERSWKWGELLVRSERRVWHSPPSRTVGSMGGRTVYVGHVPRAMDETLVATLFDNVGRVVEVRLGGDPAYDQRFAFVEFGSEEEAEKACLLDGMEVPIYGTGRFIRVAMAQGIDGIFVTDAEVDKVHKTVHVGALKQPEESALREHFKSAGKIMAVKLGKSCAWVEFDNLQAVANAVAMDGQKVGDDAAKVTRSKVPIDTAE